MASGAELRVAHCRNVDSDGDGGGGGGGVYVAGALRVDGALEVHQSHSKRDGGGVYVSRTLGAALGLSIAPEAFISRGR